jgi:4a-hydroxytetrahydrobiopterin dehydratase
MSALLAPVHLDAALSDLPGLHRAQAGHLRIKLEAPSFTGAVELIGRVALSAEKLDHHPDIDLRWRTVTFDLSTHSAGGITDLDIVLARRILEHGAALSARTMPPPDRVEVAVDAVDPMAIRDFWRVGLGYAEQANEGGDLELHHPDGTGPVIWFQRMDPPRPGRGRLHLDVYVPADAAAQRVADALAAGGRLVTDEHAPDWWVLADAEGNELCVCT